MVFPKVRLIPLLMIAGLLLACASKADDETQRIQSLAQQALAQAQFCNASISAKPQYAHIYQKVAVGLENGKFRTPTPAMLADNGRPSDDDIAHGLDWYAESQTCNRTGLDTLGKIDPELLIISARSEQENAILVRDIVRDRPTYGVINSRLVENRQRVTAAINQWGLKLRARLDAMRQQEQIEHAQFMAQVGAISEALAMTALTAISILAQQQQFLAQTQMNFARAHPVYVPAYRVTTTNCQWIGRFLSCTSN